MSKLEQMRGHIETQLASGYDISAYCAEHKLKPSTFHYWKKKLMMPQQDVQKGFTKLSVPTASMNKLLTIQYPNGIQCSFNILPDVLFIKNLLHVTS